MTKTNDENTLWTSANIVTIIRILFVPIFVAALLSPWPSWIDNSGGLDFIKPWVALLIFVLLSVTDSVDGYLARSKNQVTNFGKFMDPLADKILVFAALISLVELSVLPTWVVLIILMREFIVSGVRMLAASKGLVIAASWYGKAKTVTQLIAIILFILKESLSATGAQSIASPLYIFAWVVMIVALILTIVSMIDYIYKARAVFKDSEDKSDSLVIAKEIVEMCKFHNIKIGFAESLTGGKVSSVITCIPGSSSVFAGGVVSYMYEIKTKLLGVNAEKLKKQGAVNAETAEIMSRGAIKTLCCDYSLSTTGIAGPDKDEFSTPVGTVFVACSNKNKTTYKELKLSGTREEIRNSCVYHSLLFLKEFISNNL